MLIVASALKRNDPAHQLLIYGHRSTISKDVVSIAPVLLALTGC